MCLAMPYRIKETDEAKKHAIAEAEGLCQDIRVDLINDPKPGDYVLVHAGFAIERLSREQAEKEIELMREIADAAGKRS